MRFLFISPNRTFVRNNIWGVVNSIPPPLGLATLSAVLEKNGHETEIIDAYTLNLSISDILSEINPMTDIIGITATTPEINDAIKIAQSIRNHFPKIKILMGGVHPTVFHKSLVEERVCDMVIRGEGENVILKIACKASMDSIPNLTWRSPDGEIVVNPQKDEFVNLDELPFPSYYKLPMNKYRSAIGAAKRSPCIGMVTSRGCPGKCNFCFSKMFGLKLRFMSAETVFKHILHLKSNYGIREISFYDDTFTANRKRIEELCNLMISERVDMTWSCFARVDSVTPGILKLIKEAGCHQIMYGFESVDQNVLNAIDKRTNVSKYSNTVLWTRDAGINIRGAFMLGNPEETIDSIKSTIEYSKKMGIQYAIYNITTPFPGTELFSWAMENGFIKHTNWSLYDLSHAILELPTVSSEVVEEYYHEAYKNFYFRLLYIFQHLFSLRTMYELETSWKAFLGLLQFRNNEHSNP